MARATAPSEETTAVITMNCRCQERFSPAPGSPTEKIWRRILHFIEKRKRGTMRTLVRASISLKMIPTQASLPMTVESATPSTPILGAPKSPKRKTAFKHIVMRFISIEMYIESRVRP